MESVLYLVHVRHWPQLITFEPAAGHGLVDQPPHLLHGYLCMSCVSVCVCVFARVCVYVTGAAPLIAEARRLGMSVGIGSSGAPAKIRHNLSTCGLLGLVDDYHTVSAAYVQRVSVLVWHVQETFDQDVLRCSVGAVHRIDSLGRAIYDEDTLL